VPVVARVLWGTGVAAIVATRLSARGRRAAGRLATGGLLAAAVYIALMILGSHIASAYAAQWLDRESPGYRDLMAGPLPVDPFLREIIVTREAHYSFLEVNVLTGSVQPSGSDIAINGPTAITEAALGSPAVRGLRNWLRFPSYEVEATGDGYRVHIRDVRYSRFGARARGIGQATVDLDAELRPR
jgi:inner membrane protein